LAYIRQLCHQQGVKPEDLRRAEDQYLSSHRGWSAGDREAFIRRSAAGFGLEPHAVDQAFDDIESVADMGFPDFAPLAPLPADDQRRLEEIGDIMRKDPHRYTRENLGDEAVDIRNRLGSELGTSRPIPTEAPARNDRIDELRGMMRDPASNYWRGPRAESLQAEYRALHTEPTGGQPSASGSPTPTTTGDNQ
jgi:hypothetical protein